MINLIVALPLPISKNAKWVRKGFWNKRTGKWENAPLLSEEARLLRLMLHNKITMAVRQAGVVFKAKTKTILGCRWFRKDLRGDVVNFHDEIADIVKGAIGVDDRYFLVRDEDYEVTGEQTGLILTISQNGQ